MTKNLETGQSYHWNPTHCKQYVHYEKELNSSSKQIDRTILLDMADTLIDSENTRLIYQEKANVVCYEGGSHSFDHINQALPLIEAVMFRI